MSLVSRPDDLAHGQGWLTSLTLAMAALAVTYFVFIVFLKVNLPVWPIGLAP